MKAKKGSSSSSCCCSDTAAVERKEIERKRRQHMKNLCAKLVSLIPKEHYSSKDTMTQLGSLDEAAAYIKKLKERVDDLQQQKRSSSSSQLMARSMRGGGAGASTSASAAATTGDAAGSSTEGTTAAEDDEAAVAPVVEVRHHEDDGSGLLDVVLVSSVERPFKMHEVVTVLEEEGAEIINANFSVAAPRIFYTIHSRAFSSRIGIEVSRVSERLRALV